MVYDRLDNEIRRKCNILILSTRIHIKKIKNNNGHVTECCDMPLFIEIGG